MKKQDFVFSLIREEIMQPEIIVLQSDNILANNPQKEWIGVEKHERKGPWHQ